MTGMPETNDIRFERVTGSIGAIVHGVQLAGEKSASTTERLRHALHEHGVLFFRFDQEISPEAFAALGRVFGEKDDVNRFSLRDKNVNSINSAQMPAVDCWHSDSTPFECPPGSAMLMPLQLPEAGGDTMWASMYAAWEGLSSHYQRLLEGLEVVHSLPRHLVGYLEPQTTTHPAMIRDPVTGKKILYVNSMYCESVVGMSEKESDALLHMLSEHVNTPEFHVRLRWRMGTVAVWEQRATQHRAVADFTGHRRLTRLAFLGERPQA